MIPEKWTGQGSFSMEENLFIFSKTDQIYLLMSGMISDKTNVYLKFNF